MLCAYTRPMQISGERLQDHWSSGYSIKEAFRVLASCSPVVIHVYISLGDVPCFTCLYFYRRCSELYTFIFHCEMSVLYTFIFHSKMFCDWCIFCFHVNNLFQCVAIQSEYSLHLRKILV